MQYCTASAVDYNADEKGFALPESGAILYYLADRDPSHKLLPTDPAAGAEALSWVFYQSVCVCTEAVLPLLLLLQ